MKISSEYFEQIMLMIISFSKCSGFVDSARCRYRYGKLDWIGFSRAINVHLRSSSKTLNSQFVELKVLPSRMCLRKGSDAISVSWEFGASLKCRWIIRCAFLFDQRNEYFWCFSTDLVDNENRTALHWASRLGFDGVADVLMNNGANINQADRLQV